MNSGVRREAASRLYRHHAWVRRLAVLVSCVCAACTVPLTPGFPELTSRVTTSQARKFLVALRVYLSAKSALAGVRHNLPLTRIAIMTRD